MKIDIYRNMHERKEWWLGWVWDGGMYLDVPFKVWYKLDVLDNWSDTKEDDLHSDSMYFW